MKRDYVISIVGIQKTESEVERVEFTTWGTYKREGNTEYIIYEEYAPELPGGNLISSIQVENKNLVILDRHPDKRTKLLIEQGKRHLCFYNTSFGNLMLSVFASSVKNNLSSSGGNLFLQYNVSFNSVMESVNELYINMKKVEKESEKTNGLYSLQNEVGTKKINKSISCESSVE